MANDDGDLKVIPLELSGVAREGLHSFVAAEGCTLTAFMEVLGLHLAGPRPELVRALRPVTTEARALAAQRRRRHR